MPVNGSSGDSSGWDYFLSHASEDKALIAEPLAYVFRETTFTVWYDAFSLRVGDSLMASIDTGLRQSQFGIVILSPSFFAKNWPQRELAGMMALAAGNRKILPVWHNVTATQVAQYSPILADRVGVSTGRGLFTVAEEIVKASFPNRLGLLRQNRALDLNNSDLESARKRFQLLLDSNPSVDDVRLFLSAYHGLLNSIRGYNPLLVHRNQFGDLASFDFAMIAPHGWSGPVELIFVILGPPTTADLVEAATAIFDAVTPTLGEHNAFERRPANDYLGSPYLGEYPELSRQFTQLEIVLQHREIAEQDGARSRRMINIHLPDPETWSFSILLLIGRRDDQSVTARHEFKTSLAKTMVAAYDRLLDTRKS